MRESAGLLKESWYAAGLPSEISASRPLARTIFGERLVLWRAADGRVAALSDRCRHRNAPLSGGVIIDGCAACPYHGWVYDPDGKLIAIPAFEDGAEVPELAVRAWPTKEAHGLVWVWMGDGPPTREPFAMPYWDTPGWSAYYQTTVFDNGVTQLVENFMDVPHTVFVHRGWFRSERRKPVRTVVERTPDSVLVTYDQPEDEIGFTGRILNPRGEPMVHTDKFYLPNTTRVDYEFGSSSAFVITSTCTPEAPYRTRVYTLISFRFPSRLATRLAAPLLRPYTRQVLRQDVDIMKLQGDNLRHHEVPAFHSTTVDLHHQWIEELRDWAAAGGGQPAPEPTVEEVTFWL